jgi:hypothetical protein
MNATRPLSPAFPLLHRLAALFAQVIHRFMHRILRPAPCGMRSSLIPACRPPCARSRRLDQPGAAEACCARRGCGQRPCGTSGKEYRVRHSRLAPRVACWLDENALGQLARRTSGGKEKSSAPGDEDHRPIPGPQRGGGRSQNPPFCTAVGIHQLDLAMAHSGGCLRSGRWTSVCVDAKARKRQRVSGVAEIPSRALLACLTV